MSAIDILVQALMTTCGLTAMWCSQGHNVRARRWAPVIGLAGQPAWGYFAWQTSAAGVGLLTLAWAAVYVRGIWVHWSPVVVAAGWKKAKLDGMIPADQQQEASSGQAQSGDDGWPRCAYVPDGPGRLRRQAHVSDVRGCAACGSQCQAPRR